MHWDTVFHVVGAKYALRQHINHLRHILKGFCTDLDCHFQPKLKKLYVEVPMCFIGVCLIKKGPIEPHLPIVYQA